MREEEGATLEREVGNTPFNLGNKRHIFHIIININVVLCEISVIVVRKKVIPFLSVSFASLHSELDCNKNTEDAFCIFANKEEGTAYELYLQQILK